MKKNIISSAIAFVLLMFLIISITYAWYTNTYRSKSIDFSTSGIVLSYSLDSQYNNVDTYDVKNVVFFDVNANEGKFFSTMAQIVEIDVKNISQTAISVNVQQVNILNQDAYIACIFTDSILDSTTSNSSINLFLTEKNVSNQYSCDLEINEVKTIYMYVYGVQNNANSDNAFLDDVYNFSFRIYAEKR